MNSAAPPRPTSVLRRTRFAAWWGALLAVRSRVRLSEYLGERVGTYRRGLLAQGISLPVEVVLENGRIRLSPLAVAEPQLQPSPTDVEAHLAAVVGPGAVAELHEAELQSEVRRGRIEVAREAVSARRREVELALADGSAASTGVRGRMAPPRVPGLLWPLLVFGFAVLLLAAEAWQAAVPFLDMSGVDTSDIGAEIIRSPVAVALGFAFAIGATAVLVYLAHLAAVRFTWLLDDDRDLRARAVDGTVAVALCVVAFAFAWGLAAMRHAASRAGADLAASMAGGAAAETSRLTFFLLVALIPFFGAALWDVGVTAMARRAAAQDAAHRHEQDLLAREEKRERLEEALASAERELAELELERSSSRQTAIALRTRGAAAGREAAMSQRRHADLQAAAREDLAAVLEVDRYAFVRRASQKSLRMLVDDRDQALGSAERRAVGPATLRPEAA